MGSETNDTDRSPVHMTRKCNTARALEIMLRDSPTLLEKVRTSYNLEVVRVLYLDVFMLCYTDVIEA